MRVFLFIAVNLAVIVLLMVTVSVLGLDRYLEMQTNGALSVNHTQLALFSLVWGFGGAFISLWISKWMAKKFYGVQVIDPQQASAREKQLLSRVYDYANKAGLRHMPEVGIYDSVHANAFATGASKKSALVALSTGLLDSLSEEEVNGVIAHEVAHIANGDMITMTLLQGVINAFVIFFAKVIAIAAANALKRESEQTSFWLRIGIEMVLHILLGFVGLLIVHWFSRQREYRADYGAAQIAGKKPMLAALRRLSQMEKMSVVQGSSRSYSRRDREGFGGDEAVACFQISNVSSKKKSFWVKGLSTHPPMEERIARLEALQTL